MFKNRKENGQAETEAGASATASATAPAASAEPTVQPFRPASPRAATPEFQPRGAASTPPAAPFPAATFPSQAARPSGSGSRPAVHSDKRTLVVGRGITVAGSVQDAERLVVEGTVEAPSLHAVELSVAEGGVLKGDVNVEEAEVAGFVDGTLTTSGVLLVRATGRLVGTARCRRLQVEDGGEISGRIEMMTDPRVSSAPAASAPRPTPATAAPPPSSTPVQPLLNANAAASGGPAAPPASSEPARARASNA